MKPDQQTRFATNRELYELVLRDAVRSAEQFVWIATANIKDLYVDSGKRMVPFLQVLSELIARSVSVRLLHAREPGPAFREDFDRFPKLITGLERMLCPRTHFKAVIVDGRIAYTGSANLTGAGIGAKSPDRRNFESGIVTTNPELVDQIMAQFDDVWMGRWCPPCERKEYCPEYGEMERESGGE